ncbi:hypothetical protein [Cupriavidus sp. UYPR2.512]|uniref:hypothetical protein n=1 Tax=Cupriavidus sp. UYPR2.512 TaxID=1080187 RepID=UPI000368CD5D|nr:hypothetical protein [Cupriavidus sp. UYPR2.512]UIF89280.1 hypothetical protein KAF44_30380 [Cupriavidus necator]
MSWFITGRRDGLVLRVSEAGVPILGGKGLHECRPADGGRFDKALLKRIEEAGCEWTITVPTQSELHIDPSAEGLYERVQEAPSQSHAAIQFFELDGNEFVGFSIVVPESTFEHIRRLLELVLLSDSLEYMATVNFLTFRAAHAQTETPTLEEFIDGKPLFVGEVTFLVKPISKQH